MNLAETLKEYNPKESPQQHYMQSLQAYIRNHWFNDDEFTNAIAFVIDVCGIDMRTVAGYIGVSGPTVKRWKEGKNLPHKPLRGPTLHGLAELIREQKENK